MTHPADAGIQLNAIIPAHDAEGMAQIIRNDCEFNPFRQFSSSLEDFFVLKCPAVMTLAIAIDPIDEQSKKKAYGFYKTATDV